MTDLDVLVLTDDELTAISGANRTAWPLPLGGDRDGDTVTTSAQAGERSLFARRLLERRNDAYTLGKVASSYLLPALRTDPQVVVCVVDDQLRWVLQGMSLAWYGEDGVDVLEARAANGLHHFTHPSRDNLRAALRNYLTSAHDEGFPDALPGVELSLYVATVGAGRAFRIRRGSVEETPLAGKPLTSVDWQPSSLDDVLGLVENP